jgi:hypothetical protein
MITIHRQLKYVIFFALGFFVANFAFAGTIATPQTTNNFTPACDIGERGYYIADGEEPFDFYYLPNGSTLSSDIGENELLAQQNCETQYTLQNGVYDIQFCYETDINYCSGDFISFVVAGNNNSQGNISFIDTNDITPEQMFASVKEGTVETTEKTLPLLVFLGIPVALLLLLALINLINQTLTPENSRKSHGGKGKKETWTAKGAIQHDYIAFRKKERSKIKRDIAT